LSGTGTGLALRIRLKMEDMKIKMAIAVSENAGDVVFAEYQLMESANRIVVYAIVNITQIKVLLNSVYLLFYF